MCGLYRYGGSRTRVYLAGTGLRPTRRARPRRCGAWLLTGRCSARDGGAALVVSSVPRLGPTSGRCMQDDEDGAGSVAARRPVHGRRSRVRGTELASGVPRI